MSSSLYPFKTPSEQLINFEPVLRGAWLRPLRDPAYFKRVRLNDAGNLEWPDGQDFSPEVLHDWPAFEQFYIQDGEQAEQAEQEELRLASRNTSMWVSSQVFQVFIGQGDSLLKEKSGVEGVGP